MTDDPVKVLLEAVRREFPRIPEESARCKCGPCRIDRALRILVEAISEIGEAAANHCAEHAVEAAMADHELACRSARQVYRVDLALAAAAEEVK